MTTRFFILLSSTVMLSIAWFIVDFNAPPPPHWPLIDLPGDIMAHIAEHLHGAWIWTCLILVLLFHIITLALAVSYGRHRGFHEAALHEESLHALINSAVREALPRRQGAA